MSGQLKGQIQECRECREHAIQRREPLIPTPLPTHPWEVVGADLFQLKGVNYLLIVDYFSRYPELIKLTTTTSLSVINALKAAFARHGIPALLRSDNGPQFDSSEMKSFAQTYGFDHKLSSPRCPQSNGQVERCIQTIKNLLRKLMMSSSLCWCIDRLHLGGVIRARLNSVWGENCGPTFHNFRVN